MKATARTAAQKLKAKRGRPRNEDAVCREPNGRASRAKEPADLVGLEARARQMGISLVQAKDQKAATFIGVLSLRGPRDGLSEAQYRGAQDFLAARNRYLMALKAPNAMADTGTGGSSSDLITDGYIEWCRAAIETHTDATKAIQEAQNADRTVNLWAALDLCLVQNLRMEHMLPDVRCLCNVFVRFFKTDGGDGRRIRAFRT
jgi:hypothetical protein